MWISAILSGLALLTQVQASQGSRAPQVTPQASCPASAVDTSTPPPDPNSDSFQHFGPWYVNADRTIWVNAPAPGTAATGQRVWIRPQGKQLVVTGRRLDGNAPPVAFEESVGSYPTGSYFGSPNFPIDGCWEMTAKAGASTLTYVIPIRYAIEAFAARPSTRTTWRKEIGRIQAGDASVAVSAVVLEDPASLTRVLKGARIDLASGARTAQVYEEDVRLDGTRTALERMASGSRPMMYGLGRTYTARTETSGLWFVSSTGPNVELRGYPGSGFAALLLRAADELRGR